MKASAGVVEIVYSLRVFFLEKRREINLSILFIYKNVMTFVITMRIKDFKKEKKNQKVNIRIKEADKRFMETFGISPTKVWNYGFKKVKNKAKKEKKNG